ncbi:MutS-related protein [Alicyclobacillus sp. ALC3]|uniref:MutS-related protein n=1 Tax=Alicyclobacillus sp. ALC3 TaxID=2796143 RepID=UPI002377E8D4|nr:hypothetical protein [Alicyclobacillus sp. ALC3]WDL95133.1 hypothetical protein JC200_11915 [Alicyclobacillus sp. ALC3]
MTTARQAVNSTRPAPFLNPDSIADLHWHTIWQVFAPVTPFGRRAKAALQPYRTGEEAAAEREFDQLKSDVARLDATAIAAIAEGLQHVPDVADALVALAEPATVLSVKQLLALKQFLFYGAGLAGAASAGAGRGDAGVADARAKVEWTSPSRWSASLAQFGEVAVPSFAIDHVADDTWRTAAAALTQATYALHMAKQDRDKSWQEEVGVRPTREGHVVLRLPQQRPLAEQLMADGRLQWLRNTPFEAVFAVQPTPHLTAAEAGLRVAKEALETAQDYVLAQFCDALRGLLPDLQRLAEDIAALDLRVAKVRLLRQWNGAVPTIGENVRLQGGVHPIVAARLQDSGDATLANPARPTSDLARPLANQAQSAASSSARPPANSPGPPASAYVPLDFNPDLGPNVLCGANMGGKTVAMSLLCLCQALTQYGLPVPAQAFETRLFRFIRFCGRAGTDLDNGLSAYGREITNLEHTWALWQDVGDGFVCLDEPARSTNPLEGEALVVAMLRLIREQPRNSVWIVATHLAGAVAEPGLAKFRVRGLAGRLPPGALPVAGSVPPGEVSPPTEPSQTEAQRLTWLARAMDYRLVRMTDDTPPAEALQVAKWLGLADEILTESQRYLGEGKP